MFPARFVISVLVLATAFLSGAASAQTDSPSPSSQPHRTRLILKDGSYQIVMSYRLTGMLVSYVSAERDGEQEEIPASLVDWEATGRWEQQHGPAPQNNSAQQNHPDAGQPPVLDPELAKEEADRAALTPEVVPDLRLPELGSAFALDSFRGTPELVPLPQNGGEQNLDLDPNTAHSVVKLILNPLASPHRIVELRRERSPFQMHVNTPLFYLRVGDDADVLTGSGVLTVDTHGVAQKAGPSGGSPDSRYVVLRADVRTGTRVLNSFSIGALGTRQQTDVMETTTYLLPGGHWLAVTPKQPLSSGEYALMEVLSDHDVNLGVWDFGVHPTAGENGDALKPQPKRPIVLERR